jgi:hypothetical protein
MRQYIYSYEKTCLELWEDFRDAALAQNATALYLQIARV